MSQRRSILVNIKQSLGREGLSAEQISELRGRFNQPEEGIRPYFDKDLTERFVEKMEAVAGTTTRVAQLQQVPAAVDDYLKRHDLDSKVVMADTPLLQQIDWPGAWGIERRAAQGADRISITGAFAAVAETGSLAILSSAHSPTTLNFLPDDHIVVLRTEQIVSHMEDLWWLIRKSGQALPRTINYITGPSRTADVEQTIQLGAHGPRRLHVVLVEN